jgi:hypothetical protein
MYCDDVDRVLEGLGKQRHPDGCHLFIKYLMLRFTALLLRNGNKQPSVPTAHAFQPVSRSRDKINYHKHYWYNCGGLTSIIILLYLHLSCAKLS